MILSIGGLSGNRTVLLENDREPGLSVALGTFTFASTKPINLTISLAPVRTIRQGYKERRTLSKLLSRNSIVYPRSIDRWSSSFSIFGARSFELRQVVGCLVLANYPIRESPFFLPYSYYYSSAGSLRYLSPIILARTERSLFPFLSHVILLLFFSFFFSFFRFIIPSRSCSPFQSRSCNFRRSPSL